jgi:hypothetical protein
MEVAPADACYPDLNIPEGHDHKYALGTGNGPNGRSCGAECRASCDCLMMGDVSPTQVMAIPFWEEALLGSKGTRKHRN